MKLFAQKSLKTGLQIKRYEVLKLQGLDCKFTGAKYGIESETKG
jgi:hypothetical protein